MWDNDIRKNLKKKGVKLPPSFEGYLNYLKYNQNELKNAFSEYEVISKKNQKEIEMEIREKCKNKTLSKIIDGYNLAHSRPDFLKLF
jgi:hypothetical protein